MAIQITRKEYEKMFGSSPVINTETFDTTPPPTRVTRAEYDAMFNPKEKSGVQKVGEQVKQSFTEGFEKSKKGLSTIADSVRGIKDVQNVSDVEDLKKQAFRGGLRFFGGAVDAAFSPIAPIFAPIGKGVNAVADKISDAPIVQKFASGKYGQEAEEKTQDLLDIVNIASVLPASKLASGFTSKVVKKIPSIDEIKATRQASTVKKISDEVLNIENSYNKTAVKNSITDDMGTASRNRIANTDVLSGLVDEDGKITIASAKSAAESYRKQTIDGAEGVVREILKKEGKAMNVEQIRRVLVEEISSSGLQGADLLTAMNGIKKEINGLKLRADEFGNVPNYILHDAKISTTKNIDYTKPPQVSYRRSLANGYRKIVENNSVANVEVGGKIYKIKDINQKLGDYLGDIERIEMLGGKRIKGGRLGKYTAQISGNLTGAGVGGLVGGPLGMAIGTVVGGEVASKIRGKQMASTFGKAKGRVAPKSDVLEAAIQKGKETGTVDLRKPDAKVGAAKSVKKTKEIMVLEQKIAKNVAEQKKAIKAGNFTLVATLKEVYQALVDKLKSVIKRIKETPNQQGGFVANPFSRDFSKAGSPRGKEIKISTYKSNVPQTKSASSSLSTGDKKLIESLSTAQRERFNSGSIAEQKKAIEYLRLKDGVENNSSIKNHFKPESSSVLKTEKFYIKGKDGKMIGSIPRKSIVEIPTKKIKIGEDFDNAIGDVNVGQKSMTNLPILVKKNSSGMYEVLDGNHRLAQQMRKGVVRVTAMTDEPLYRQLSEKQDSLQSKVGGTIPENSLTTEARKYKSAEEFVKAQPTVYHGSQTELKQFSNKQGTFFTDDMMNADGYGGGNVYEGYLNLKNPLVIDAKGRFYEDLKTPYGKSTREIVSNVDSKKYDGVVFKNIGDSYVGSMDDMTTSTVYYAFKPKDAFLNESQLTDIYNKAVGK